MFYKVQPPPPQVRTRCRNARCGTTLKIPTDNPRDAFCSNGCREQFYRYRCRVCEAAIPQKTKPRVVCWRSKCRHEIQRFPARFFGPWAQIPDLGQISSRNPLKPGLKIGSKSGRGWRVVAGPEPGPANFLVPPEPGLISESYKAFQKYRKKEKRRLARLARNVLFGHSAPPANIVGGHKFPNAPKVDLSQPLAGDGLDIPAFLLRARPISGGRS